MSISDWSSDVCSSDLGDAGQAAAPLQQAHGLQLVEPRQLLDVAEPEMIQESGARTPLQRPPGRLAAAARPDPAGLQQGVEGALRQGDATRSEEHTSELQSLMRTSYAVFCLKKKTNKTTQHK